jgi:hypothetical protein
MIAALTRVMRSTVRPDGIKDEIWKLDGMVLIPQNSTQPSNNFIENESEPNPDPPQHA